MVFLHLGDLHIGRSLGDYDLAEDQEYILSQLVSIAVKNGAGAVLIAGDVYDKPVPSESAVRLFDGFLNSLAEKGIKAFIISGNHDSDERINFGSGLFRRSGIFIHSNFSGALAKETVEDEFGRINIWLMPFVKASAVRHFYPDDDIPDYDSAVRKLIEESEIDPSERNIIVAHQFVAGKSAEPTLGGSESPAVLNVGLVERVGADCFDIFDYAALGHIHSAQAVGRETVRYSGSPLKYSLSEAGSVKLATIVEIREKGNVKIKTEPLVPLRDLRHIRGKAEQLLSAENITSPNDYIYATLTDEEFSENPMGIFRQYYPNTVKIDYDNSRTREILSAEVTADIAAKTFEETVAEFYRLVYGCDISEEELEIMKKAAGEAGVSVEAD